MLSPPKLPRSPLPSSPSFSQFSPPGCLASQSGRPPRKEPSHPASSAGDDNDDDDDDNNEDENKNLTVTMMMMMMTPLVTRFFCAGR